MMEIDTAASSRKISELARREAPGKKKKKQRNAIVRMLVSLDE